MKTFPTERTSHTQNFPFPSEGEIVYENPPTMIWVPVDGAESYTLTVYDENKNVLETIETAKNYTNPKAPLAPGTYFWTVETGDLRRDFMSFRIAENALLFERPDAEALFAAYPAERPAYLFSAEDIEQLKKERTTELSVLQKNVEIALARPLPAHPAYHKDGDYYAFRYYFANHRTVCDRDLVACALSYVLTGNEAAGKKGRELLMEICDWNPIGPCAVDGDYDDETGISNIRCLPPAFDMLYPLLSARERKYIAATIAVYAQQCENKLRKINYEKNPSHSHAGRVPAYLGGAALVLKGTGAVEEETLIRWLRYALDIYGGIFPYYGGNDGSWAEGTFYAASYTKWYLPFFAAVERYSGKSLFDRPFYHRYTNFLIHFCNKDYEIHPFGDGYWCDSDSAEWPGFFAQNPYTVYADKFGPALAVKRREEAADQSLYMLHLLDLFLPTLPKPARTLAVEPSDTAVFPDGGFAAMHTDLQSEDDIAVLIRASRFPYDSHRHADQGSFALFSAGVAMISPSGYYGWGYGTKHHMQWTKSTKAHNALLFNGHDQRVVPLLQSVGKILDMDPANKRCLLDLSSAYDKIRLWQRELTLEAGCLTVVDTVEADEPVEVLYPLHTLSEPYEKDGSVWVERKGQKLEICTSDLTLIGITDKPDVDLNEGVPAQDSVTMPPQYHIYYQAEKAEKHTIRVCFRIHNGQNL